MTWHEQRLLKEATYNKLRETRVDMPDGKFTHEAAEFLADLHSRVTALEERDLEE